MPSSIFSYGCQLVFDGLQTCQNRWNQSLTPRQQIVTAIALAALSGLAAIYAIVHYVWKHQVKEERNLVLPASEEEIVQPEISDPIVEIADIEPFSPSDDEIDSNQLSDDKVDSNDSSNNEVDSDDSSEDAASPVQVSPNRHYINIFSPMATLLDIRARAANMPLSEFVFQEVNGQLPSAFTASTRPDYQDEVKKAKSNFNRLFEHGKSLIQSLEGNVSALDQNKEEHSISVASPVDLAAGNIAIRKMLEKTVLDEIQSNSCYADYCGEIRTGDFREIKGISAKRIEEILQKLQIIDGNKRMIPGSLNQKVQTDLKGEIGNPEISKKVLEVLYCLILRSNREMILWRLTKSTFLDPRLLSQMSQNQLTIEEANLLLACLGLRDNKNVSVCNLRTGEYSKDIVSKLRKKQPPALCFIDPNELKSEFEKDPKLPPKSNLEDAVYNGNLISKGTQCLAGLVYEKLEPILKCVDHDSCEYVKNEIIKASSDHIYLKEICFDSNQLEQFFKEKISGKEVDAIIDCFKNIRIFLSPRLDKLDQLVKELPDRSKLMEDSLTIEAEARLEEAIAAKDKIFKKFEEFKHILRQFLLFSTQTFELAKSHPYKIHWKMDEIEVEEVIILEKSCAVFRRLYFPAIEKSDRADLTYFAEGEKDCIDKRWKDICLKYNMRDKELAEKLLVLYACGSLDGKEPLEIKQFLVPLVILLMGKEPALDRSSLAANFILLLSVKLGVQNFAAALEKMPMIPKGGASAKQFLLHVGEHSLDAISGVQYKEHKTVVPSYFLPTVAAFLGTANDWIQKYDDVATVAVSCCQRLFVLPLNHIQSLKTLILRLNSLMERKLKIWEIPLALDCREIEKKKEIVEEICLDYIDLIGKTDSLPHDETRSSAAVELCRTELRASLKNKHLETLIDQLNDLFNQEYTSAELADMLDLKEIDDLINIKRQIANDYLISVGETDNKETAIERCQEFLTPGIDSSNKQIQELKMLLDRIYETSIPYSHLAEAIEHSPGLNDPDDEIGKWAINYILALHPLDLLRQASA